MIRIHHVIAFAVLSASTVLAVSASQAETPLPTVVDPPSMPVIQADSWLSCGPGNWYSCLCTNVVSKYDSRPNATSSLTLTVAPVCATEAEGGATHASFKVHQWLREAGYRANVVCTKTIRP